MRTWSNASNWARQVPGTTHAGRRRLTAALVGMVALVLMPIAAAAQCANFIRDDEIESLLQSYAGPILDAAGLGSQAVRIRILKAKPFNAFVLDGRNIFVNSGTLVDAETANEVIGVIAHETGHIAGGHLASKRAKIQGDLTRNLLMKVLGIGAVIAGAASGQDTTAGAGQSILSGSDAVTMRSILLYSRTLEAQADQAALRFLDRTGQSARGMITTFERLSTSGFNGDRYLLSHPLPQDRINNLVQAAEKSPHFRKVDTPEVQLRHDLMRAKLRGYIDKPQIVFNTYPNSDQTLPARYARAIATARLGSTEKALALVDALIAENPTWPFFHELKGDVYMRANQPGPALAPLRKALQLLPKSNLIRVELAHALLRTNDRGVLDEAIKLLQQGLVGEDNAFGYLQLANAYYLKGEEGSAALATAEARLYQCQWQEARAFAKRAQALLKTGTPAWIRADDIANMQPPS
ncbi:MAG: M48 family metalloprotease [Hyphomicrobiaceae bacterium]